MSVIDWVLVRKKWMISCSHHHQQCASFDDDDVDCEVATNPSSLEMHEQCKTSIITATNSSAALLTPKTMVVAVLNVNDIMVMMMKRKILACA